MPQKDPTSEVTNDAIARPLVLGIGAPRGTCGVTKVLAGVAFALKVFESAGVPQAAQKAAPCSGAPHFVQFIVVPLKIVGKTTLLAEKQ